MKVCYKHIDQMFYMCIYILDDHLQWCFISLNFYLKLYRCYLKDLLGSSLFTRISLRTAYLYDKKMIKRISEKMFFDRIIQWSLRSRRSRSLSIRRYVLWISTTLWWDVKTKLSTFQTPSQGSSSGTDKHQVYMSKH